MAKTCFNENNVARPWLYILSPTFFDTCCYCRRSLIRRLDKINPERMDHEEQLAFWINIHNALVMHVSLAIVYHVVFPTIKMCQLYSKLNSHHIPLSILFDYQALLAYGLHQNQMNSSFSILKVSTSRVLLTYFLEAHHFEWAFSNFTFMIRFQAAYDIGGHSVNAYVIQSSILGCQLHRPALVCLPAYHHFLICQQNFVQLITIQSLQSTQDSPINDCRGYAVYYLQSSRKGKTNIHMRLSILSLLLTSLFV